MQCHVPKVALSKRVGQQKDVNELRGFMQFKVLEEAAAAIVYFNNLHIRSSYILRLRFFDKKPGNETVWMQSV